MDDLLKEQAALCQCICHPDSVLKDISLGSNHSKCDPTINVGGTKHEMLWSTIARIPKTRLSKLKESASLYEILKVCDKYSAETNEYYFDRDPKSFRAIANFYRTGKLHYMDELCVLGFTEDLNYWGINELYIESCCQPKYQQRKKAALMEIKRESEIKQKIEQNFKEKEKLSRRNRVKQYLWTLLEQPQSSTLARIISTTSIILIVLSTVGLILGTMPEFAQENSNSTLSKQDVCENLAKMDHKEDHIYFKPLELVTITWFTAEFLLRFYASPDKIMFLKEPLNIIDILTLLPYYIGRFLILMAPMHDRNKKISMIESLVQFIRLTRILRILKLSRHSTGLRSLGFTFRQSYKELGLYTLFLLMAILIFSTLAYFAEKDICNTEFKSIPLTFWWALNTMTTVVYDGFKPETAAGRIISSLCGLCGVIVVALPIPIIVNNFTEFYSNQVLTEAALKRRKELHVALKKGEIITFCEKDIHGNWEHTLSLIKIKGMENLAGKVDGIGEPQDEILEPQFNEPNHM